METNEMWWTIGLIIYVIVTLVYLSSDDVEFDLSFLNPINIYESYYSLNYFGIFILTVLFNAFFLPYAIIYWIYKIVKFLITVGRN